MPVSCYYVALAQVRGNSGRTHCASWRNHRPVGGRPEDNAVKTVDGPPSRGYNLKVDAP